jgi:hypothetical protein
VGEIDPLEDLPIVHYGFEDGLEAVELADFVVAQHQGTADEGDVYGFFLFLFQLLFCFGGDVLHGGGVHH